MIRLPRQAVPARGALWPAVLLALLLAFPCPLRAAEPATDDEGDDAPPAAATLQPAPSGEQPRFLVDRLAAGASFGYFSADTLDFLAQIHFDFPFLVARQKGAYVRGSLSSSISSIQGGISSQSLSFRVEDIDYLFEAGARDYLSSRIAVAAFLGQQGSENLDRPGSAWIRYAGLGAQSASFPRPGGDSTFDWNLELGAVLDETGLSKDADWTLRGDVLWDALLLERSRLGLDLSFDSLVLSGDWRSDWRAGPRWSFDLSNGIRASLFAQYIHSRNPLGVGADGVQIGLNYSEGAYRAGGRSSSLPDVRGTLALGAGVDRYPSLFDVEAVMPPFTVWGRPSRVYVDLETNSLVGKGNDSFHFRTESGMDVSFTPSIVGGVSFEHRSYHRLAKETSNVSELNLLRAGVRSPGWEFSDRSPGRLIPDARSRRPFRLEWLAQAEYLLSSTLRGNGGWLGHAGVRLDLPSPGVGFTPFVLADVERGAADTLRAGVGLTLPVDMTVSAEYRMEDQLRTRDKSETLLIFSLYF